MKQDKFAVPVHRWATWGEGAFCHVIAKDDDTYFLVNFFFFLKFIDKKSDHYYACNYQRSVKYFRNRPFLVINLIASDILCASLIGTCIDLRLSMCENGLS